MQAEKVQVIDLKPNVAAILEAHPSAALRLPFLESRVPAGFPSPGDDYHPIKLDLRKALEPHPNATFFVRVVDDSMIEEGIYNDDLLMVDRAEEPVHGDEDGIAGWAKPSDVFLTPSHGRGPSWGRTASSRRMLRPISAWVTSPNTSVAQLSHNLNSGSLIVV